MPTDVILVEPPTAAQKIKISDADSDEKAFIVVFPVEITRAVGTTVIKLDLAYAGGHGVLDVTWLPGQRKLPEFPSQTMSSMIIFEMELLSNDGLDGGVVSYRTGVFISCCYR